MQKNILANTSSAKKSLIFLVSWQTMAGVLSSSLSTYYLSLSLTMATTVSTPAAVPSKLVAHTSFYMSK
jgi:hypothetical protein